jgi:Fe-S cluster biogenesis protein NfuA/nitrite reductase/ring-hydroxylating ferredoxin subunit
VLSERVGHEFMAAERSGPVAGATTAGGDGPAELVERVQRLTAELGAIADPSAQARAEELVAAVVSLYGEGLDRIFAALADAGDPGNELVERLAADGVVASLMLIHDLYPVELEQRVAAALDSVRPYMESHGGDVELLGIEDRIARIRLEGSCEGCPASASTLELAIKQALDEAAPDLEGLVVEGAANGTAPAEPGADGLELPVVSVAPGAAGATPSWFDLDSGAGVAEGEVASDEVGGVALVIARIEGSLLAFRDVCAGCGESLAAGRLSDGVLRCPSCGRGYFLPRAGRSLDDDHLQLEPVPLLDDATGARVALAGSR